MSSNDAVQSLALIYNLEMIVFYGTCSALSNTRICFLKSNNGRNMQPCAAGSGFDRSKSKNCKINLTAGPKILIKPLFIFPIKKNIFNSC